MSLGENMQADFDEQKMNESNQETVWEKSGKEDNPAKNLEESNIHTQVEGMVRNEFISGPTMADINLSNSDHLGTAQVEDKFISEPTMADVNLANPDRRETALAPVMNDELKIGDIVNQKYKIISVLGKGGMGTVYKVEHLLLPNKKYFALKVLHPQFSNDLMLQKRFLREVEVAMEFSHENAVQIRDFGYTENHCQFFTMDFSCGICLREIIHKESPLSEERAFNIIRQVLLALKHAHEKGIAHRDLKPENLLIENRSGREHVLVLDFGIAKIFDGKGENLTQHQSIGTPHYMSPEQAGADPLDQRTDLYSLGVILYEMVSGKLPFMGSNREIITAHILKKPTPVKKVKPDVSKHMAYVIEKAMEKDVKKRFQNAQEFIDFMAKKVSTKKSFPFLKVASFLILFVALSWLGYKNKDYFQKITKENQRPETSVPKSKETIHKKGIEENPKKSVSAKNF